MTIDVPAAFENEPPVLDFIWPGFLAETAGALVAPGATGKSFWTLESAKSPAISSQKRALINAAAEIAMTQPTGEDMAFTHAVLCQVGLPRAKIEGREFIRQAGAAWVNVQAGVLDEGNGPVLQPIPYGAMPRLALAWVSTQAMRVKGREIRIGNSAADFLRLMGLADDGRRYATLRTQMHALAACRLQLGFKGRTFSGQPVEQFDAWLKNGNSQQRALWPSKLAH